MFCGSSLQLPFLRSHCMRHWPFRSMPAAYENPASSRHGTSMIPVPGFPGALIHLVLCSALGNFCPPELNKPYYPQISLHVVGWVGYWLRVNSPMQYLPGGTSVVQGTCCNFPWQPRSLRFLVSHCEGPTSWRCGPGFAKKSQVPKSWAVEPLERPY